MIHDGESTRTGEIQFDTSASDGSCRLHLATPNIVYVTRDIASPLANMGASRLNRGQKTMVGLGYVSGVSGYVSKYFSGYVS